MKISIMRSNIQRCEVCNDVSDQEKQWNEEQLAAVRDGKQEEPIRFPGIPGFIIKDAEEYKYGTTHICDSCLRTIMVGVTIIDDKNLVGVSLDSNQ
jgi:hypothetical protein